MMLFKAYCFWTERSLEQNKIRSVPGAADSAALVLFRLLEHPCQFETKRAREIAETIKISTRRITLGIKVNAWPSRLTRNKHCRNWFK